MCALMANLLDNAIESCDKILEENPWVNLKIVKRNDMLFIHLSNSISSNDLKKNSFFKSEKENSQLHGWGMKSIERVLRKYGGNKEYIIKKNHIEMFLNIPI